MRVNVKRKTTLIRHQNTGKVTLEEKFPCAVCRKCVGINSILCQFCRGWVHSRCSGIKGKMKEDRKLKCHICANQQTDIAEYFPSIK